jgi:hypothetical protein
MLVSREQQLIPPATRTTTMTRVSSLFFASTMAILPISAFAQTPAAGAKDAAPAGMTSTAPATTTPIAGKTSSAATANVIQPAKSNVKTVASGAKTDAHGVVNPHHAKTAVPAKTVDPAKS